MKFAAVIVFTLLTALWLRTDADGGRVTVHSAHGGAVSVEAGRLSSAVEWALTQWDVMANAWRSFVGLVIRFLQETAVTILHAIKWMEQL